MRKREPRITIHLPYVYILILLTIFRESDFWQGLGREIGLQTVNPGSHDLSKSYNCVNRLNWRLPLMEIRALHIVLCFMPFSP